LTGEIDGYWHICGLIYVQKGNASGLVPPSMVILLFFTNKGLVIRL
jgi:hypothetical protein